MSETPIFSTRQGYTAEDPEITLRHEAPDWLRERVMSTAYECGLEPSDLRSILCDLLIEAPDRNNWSEFPNIDAEVSQLLHKADWFRVYDFIEITGAKLQHTGTLERFSSKINEVFIRKGIGWKFIHGQIQIRGPQAFEAAVLESKELLQKTGRKVANNEIHQALVDLSRRPEPDVTGAIQHGMAALECVARDVTGDPNDTLGALLKKHPGLLAPPLDAALAKIWGFASEQGRHLRENGAPDIKEAELVVGLAGVLTSYLVKKFQKP